MEDGPAQKKLKTSGEEVEVSGRIEASRPVGPEGKNVWDNTLSLLQRVCFLMDNPCTIPTDICFHVGDEAEQIQGHMIFFALASPVFHAMFYGNIKLQEQFVDIPDITPKAFRCLMEFVYADENDGTDLGLTVANVMDVLVASRKYLMTRLTRFCYEFVQDNLGAETAPFFWLKGRRARAEIVEKQSVAEIKRNTSKVILSDSFLELPEDMLLQLTSWNDLTVSEVELFLAIKKWRTYQEKGGKHVKFNREDGGVLQDVRFATFSAERAAQEESFDDIFSDKEIRELCLYKLVGKELTSFNANPRTPVSRPFRLAVSIYVTKVTKRKLFGTLKLLIWPDVAPKACQILRQYVENSYTMELSLMFDPQLDETLSYDRHVQKDGSVKIALTHPATEAMQDIEKTNAFWSSSNFVYFKFSDSEPSIPELTIMNGHRSALDGKLPESVFEEVTWHGVVIGKVLDGPIDPIR